MAIAKPNIVFILVDNVGWGDFSVYGGTTATPRIDKLADQEMRETTRASLQARRSRRSGDSGKQSL